MSWIRSVRPGLPALALAILAFGAAAAGADELALIDDIVIDGQRPDEPTADNLSIVVAATGSTVTGRRGMGLSADDEVRTGPGVQAVLRFLDLDPEVDPLVFVDESSAYRLIDSTSLEGFFGRLFASVAGLFSVITPGGRLGVEGTEFEVEIAADGAVDIRVLEGVVAFEPSPVPGTVAEPPAAAEDEPAARADIEIRIEPGRQKVVRLGLTLSNACPEAESFFVDSPAEIPWVRIVADPQPIEVPGGGRAQVEAEVWVDAAGIEPGLYRGNVPLRCDDCFDCALTRRSASLAVKVVGPAAESTPEDARERTEAERRREEERLHAAEMRRREEERRRTVEMRRREERAAAEAGGSGVRIRALEKARLEGPTGGTAPDPMAEDEVVQVLDWTDEVFVAVQPTYTADGDPPHFEDLEQRSRAFRAARYEAIWRNDPAARARLGNVFNDWGEDRRASRAYREALTADATLARSPELLASWAAANRRAGRLERAEELARRAVELDPRSGRANVSLGNVYRGYARSALDEGDESTASAYLDRSLESFRTASAVADPDRGGERRLRGVAETKLAETYTDLARAALARGETAEADRRLIEAQQAVRAADSAYSRSDNPFLLLAEGEVLQERARLAEARGDDEGRNRELALAQQTYMTALERHRDLAPAYYKIATVYEQRGDLEQAEAEYEKAVETQPTYTPTYQKLGRLKEATGAGSAYPGREVKMVPARPVTRPIDTTRPVPPLSGLDLSTAEQTLREAGLSLGEVLGAVSDARPGTVIAQTPAADSRVRPGTPVAVTLAQPRSFAMPDLRGLGLDEARRRLADARLGPVRIEQVERRGLARSEVTDQSPRPGSRVSAGTAVRLQVAVPRPVKVPGLVGRSEGEAIETLRKEGFAAGPIRREPSCESPGRVLAQSPEKGARLTPGSAVEMVVGAPGPNARPVPQLVGTTSELGQRRLAEAGFRLGEVDEQESGREPGTVLLQRPEAGALLGAGCPVAVTVAVPPALVDVPNFVGSEIAELERTLSRLALAVAGVRLGRVTVVESRQYADGVVVRQSPEAGRQVPRDTVVDIWVARRPAEPPRVTVPDLRKRPVKEAAAVLREMGLRPVISGNCHTVRRLSPSPGTRVAPGSSVTLIAGNCVQ